nr:hypothetical protein [Enterocloster clostridioformis]
MIQCERNLKDEKNGQRHGGKRRGRKKGRKIVRLAAVVWLLCVLSGVNAARGEPGVTGLTAFTALADARGSNADTSAGTGETLVNIADEDQLKQWYDQRLTGGDSIGVLPKNMVITKPVTLGLPDGRTNISPVEIRIPEGPIKILAPKNLAQAGVVIDNPNLFITGTKSMISVEGEGCLTLKRGQIQRDASDEPAIILRNQGTLVWEEGKDLKGLKKTDIRDERIDPPEPVPPGESQTGPEYGGTQPQLTEAVLLNIGADVSGSARLEFKNLPSDINALYILRSESGQETVEYENFLKETGNTLNTSIVADSYLIYRFQSGESSFYVKAGIEWPGGSYETDKVKIAIPETVGQGLTFSYGGGSYSYGGEYAGGYGSGFGGYGGGSTSGGDSSTQPGTQEESDAPEGPVRGRGGRRRDSYTPYSVPGYKDGGTTAGRNTEEMIQEATPSEARGPGEKDGDSDSQIQPAAGWEDTDTAGQTGEEDEIMDTEPDPSQGEVREGEDSGISGLKWYAGAVLCAVMIGCGVVCFRRRKRK